MRFGPFPLCPLVSLGILPILLLPSYHSNIPLDDIAPKSAWNLPGYSGGRHSTRRVSFHPDETNLSGEIAVWGILILKLLVPSSAWHSCSCNE